MTDPVYTNKQLEYVLVEGGKAMLRLLQRNEDSVRRTCVECLHFDHQSEHCILAAQRPPARVIAYGCREYTDDIPF